MYFFSLALFVVVLAYIAYFNRHSRLVNPKQWLTIGVVGSVGISYYYGASFYALHYGASQHDCAIISDTMAKVGRKPRGISPVTDEFIATNAKRHYRFTYYEDWYRWQFSFNGLKVGDRVCFDYVETLPMAKGYPNLLKTLSIQPNS